LFDADREKIGVTIRDTPHTDAIKVIRFDPSGKLFLSAGDDKLVKLWDVDSWKCIKTM
jgi:tRNA (guanine-N(7)-)-methyltransferase subunit TRM82